MEGNYLSPIIDAFKPILIFAVVLWGIEIIITMLIKDHKKAKRKQAREKRRLEYQDRRIANDAEHAKVTRAMRYDVLRRDNFHCVRCGKCEAVCPQHLPVSALLAQVAGEFEAAHEA